MLKSLPADAKVSHHDCRVIGWRRIADPNTGRRSTGPRAGPEPSQGNFERSLNCRHLDFDSGTANPSFLMGLLNRMLTTWHHLDPVLVCATANGCIHQTDPESICFVVLQTHDEDWAAARRLLVVWSCEVYEPWSQQRHGLVELDGPAQPD